VSRPTRDLEGFRRRLRGRSAILAAWTSIGHPSIAEILSSAGVDFVGIDLEHSTIEHEQAQRIIAATHAAGIVCLPRVASHNGEQVRRLLDSGADGVIVPQVASPTEVERIVEWCKYPPIGKRSYGVARAQGYGADFDRYVETWNERSTILIQIESIAGVEAVNELLAHEEVDGAMVGPYDLSGSLGIPGHLSDARVTEACVGVINACRRHRKACGTQLVEPTEQEVRDALAGGYSFAVLASDVFVLWKWSERMRNLISRVRDETTVGEEHRR
jgi:2-dehydro-3-deoxyglucarate aldolase